MSGTAQKGERVDDQILPFLWGGDGAVYTQNCISREG